MRGSVVRKKRFLLLLLPALAVLLVPASSRAVAACAVSGRACTLDAQCCPGLVCAPGGTCQAGCRIGRVFATSGARNPVSPCQSCQPSRSTSSWTSLECSDHDPCTADTCDPALGCVHRPVVCDDGNPCTADACDRATGRCVFTPGASCDDGNPCTTDACDPVSGCSHAPSPGPCDDGNACTTDDTCVGTTCVGGPPPACDDGSPCTVDSCDPEAGCIHYGRPLLDPTAAGTFLVFPDVVAASDAEGGRLDTVLTIRNVSSRSVIAHVSFLDGDRRDSTYCYECDFDAPLGGYGTARLLVSRSGPLTKLRNLDTNATRSCSHRMGFVTVDVEDRTHRVLTDNVLKGSQVVHSHATGSSFSVPALPIQGGTGDGDRTFAFDGGEYRRLPAFVETDFVAPDRGGPVTATLVLFTVGFRRQSPPLVDCSVIGQGHPRGGPLSSSFQFGCFTSVKLEDVDPELAYPDLGSERGRLRLTCTVHGTGAGAPVEGGVHGILVQSDGAHAWGSLLEASPSAGCPATLELTDPYRGPSHW